MIELRHRLEKDCTASGEVFLGQGARLSPALRQRRFDFRFRRKEPAVGMAEENQTHDR